MDFFFSFFKSTKNNNVQKTDKPLDYLEWRMKILLFSYPPL